PAAVDADVGPEAAKAAAAEPVVAAAPPEAAPPEPPLAPTIDLNIVLAPLERRVRQRARGKVRCRFSLLPELWRCRTDGEGGAALVPDLAATAVKIMAADASLSVGTRNFAFTEETLADFPGGRLGDFARITVRDSGPGLTDAEFAAIFDPEHSSRPPLAETAAAVQRLGGFARVESAE